MIVRSIAYGQDTTRINFALSLNGEYFELNKSYYSKSLQDSFKVELLKFYVDIELKSDKDISFSESIKNHYLIDFQKEESLHIDLRVESQSNLIEIHLGVDSLINDAGAQAADLDPVNGMYWSWQSGYVNFKMEGSSNVCQTRNKAFNLHLGGFLENLVSQVPITIHEEVRKELTLILPIESIFETHDLRVKPNVMSPSEESVKLLQTIAHSFEIKK